MKAASSVLAACAAVLAACGPAPAGDAATTTLALAFERLVPLAASEGWYEAWAETDAGKLGLGKFRISAEGTVLGPDGAPKERWAVGAAPGALRAIVVTQERPDDADSAPSDQVFLRGPFQGVRAVLAPPVPAAAFAGRDGVFLLEDAATDRDPEDRNGLWFASVSFVGTYGVDYRADVMAPGLALDPAPPGWAYAGWLRLGGHVLRMGKFDRPDRMDDWYGFSGLTGTSLPINPGGPPLPGEDFRKNLPPGLETGPDKPDLGGARVVVTLENAILANEETHPSPLHIFEGEVPASPTRLVAYPLENVAERRFPAGVAELRP